MKIKPSSFRRSSYVKYLPELLFLISVIISIVTTHYMTGHFLDSDTSSELVLSRHLLDTQTLLSPDWFYATELRFLHVQWIYAPLMLLLDDWQLVRYLGALIMQALYLASFACLVHAAGKSRKFFFYGASLLLLPVSVTYGRVVLYHNHYMINITISFLMLALSLHFTGKVDWRRKKTWLYLLCLSVLSFSSGINSIRQLMITHVPLLLAAIVLCWVEDAGNDDRTTTAFLKPANLNLLFCSVFSSVFSFLGLKAQGILCSKLGIHIGSQAENNILSFAGFSDIENILYGFFHQFGYRIKSPMLSVSGILSLGGLFTGCYLLFISAKRLLKNKNSHDKSTALLSVFFLSHVIVMILVFLITKSADSSYFHPLYFALSYPLAVFTLLIHLEELPSAIHPLRAQKLFATVAVGLLLLSGTVNIFYFLGSDRFPQVYEGLTFHDKNKHTNLVEVSNFLMEQGYDKGYAPHWENNIITEMTDGQIPMVIIDVEDHGTYGNLEYRDWLTSLWLREAPCEKPFLLLSVYDVDAFLKSDSAAYCSPIFSANYHSAYSIDNLEEFVKTLHY